MCWKPVCLGRNNEKNHRRRKEETERRAKEKERGEKRVREERSVKGENFIYDDRLVGRTEGERGLTAVEH